MTIEEEFYRVFGIKKQKYYACKDEHYNDVFDVKYPPITDRILLELICIYNNYANVNGGYPIMILGLNVNAIKESLLARCINYKDEFKQQVRSLFEVEE